MSAPEEIRSAEDRQLGLFPAAAPTLEPVEMTSERMREARAFLDATPPGDRAAVSAAASRLVRAGLRVSDAFDLLLGWGSPRWSGPALFEAVMLASRATRGPAQRGPTS